MLKFHRRAALFTVGAAIVALAGIMVSVTSVDAAPWAHSPNDWSLTQTQVKQSRQALMLLATQSEPNTTLPPRAKGAWPSNVTSARGFGTDRVKANEAMGTAGAIPGADTQPVVCVEGRGAFSTAATPRPPGAKARTYTYAVVCFDPTTGQVLDSGYDDKPLRGRFASSRDLDIASPVN